MNENSESHQFEDDHVIIKSDAFYEGLTRQLACKEMLCRDRNPEVLGRLMNFSLDRDNWRPAQFVNNIGVATWPAMVSLDDHDRNEVAKAREHLAAGFARCGSPLEEMFLVGITRVGLFAEEFFSTLSCSGENIGWWPRNGIKIFQQHAIRNYRADFAFIQDTGAKFVVELDGHTFHSSRDALVRDKSRDRAMQEEGYRVLRFTFDEIWCHDSKSIGFDRAISQVLKIIKASESSAAE